MHIALVLTQSLESPSGLGRYWPVARELVKLGYRVSIIAPHHNFNSSIPLYEVRDGVEIWISGQMHVRKVGSRKEYFSPARLIQFSLRTAYHTARLIRKIKPDAIHLGKPQPINGAAARWVLLPGHQIDVTPHPSYAQFQSKIWTRETARATVQLSGNLVLFFGLVRPYKGLLDLLAALPEVLKRVEVTLLVVGEIWGKPEVYLSQVKKLGLETHVQFIDRYVSNDEVAVYFAASDLAVLPYREATGSGVLQLAFGFGLPVIATRTGGMGEAVDDGETGFLVEPGDVPGLQQAITRFFCEKRAAEFRQNIEKHAIRFGWNKITTLINDAAPR
jgi:glycosyltransferase involved in cell wall biosynthesis